MPYSESVSMNRNIPKAKSSPKWRRPKPSADKTRFMEKPNFTSRTGKLVDVLYGRRHCNSRGDITLLCTYFEANERYLHIILNYRMIGNNFHYFQYLMCQGRLQRFVLVGPSHNFQKTIICLFLQECTIF